jgi:ribonuclease R
VSNRIPGQDELLRQAVERALVEAGRRGLSRGEVAHLAGTAGAEDYVPLLSDLEREGDAVEWNKRWYALSTTDWCAGELQALAGGDALLRSGAGGEVGYFVPQRYLNGGRPGDQVIAKPLREKKKRTGQRLPEAGVVKVVGRGFDRLVGTLEERGAKHYLVPFDRRIRLEVEVADGDAVPAAHFVSVAVDHKGSSRLGPLRGRVERVLGAAEDPGVDADVVVEHFGLPTAFPPAAEQEASALPENPSGGDFEGRRDLRSELVVTIDGATAKDFDDAIGVRKREDGSFDLAVHIADVAHYVPLGCALDGEAYRRGTSVYLGDRVQPMLPEGLSNGLCSLRPNVPRLVQSVFLHIGGDGQVQSREFADAVIQSRRRLTYTEVSELLAGTGGAGAESVYGEVLPMLRHAEELTDLLMAARARRGSIDFDLPVGDVLLDDEGTAIGVQPSQRTVSHRMVEEFMLAANEAVAAELFSASQPAMFRIHDPPREQRLSELREILLGLDYELPSSLEGLHPSVLQAVMNTFAGRPEEPFVSALVLRSMQRARYANEDLGHYALSERHYTHFTSPIRRYPDLVAHRKLRALRAPAEPSPPDENTRLGAVADHCSEMERRAERSERELRRWRLVRLLADRVGEVLWGRVTGVEPFGLFIELEDFFVDGLVAVRDLDDDFYVYDPANHRLDGRRTQRSFRLADRVEVSVKAVDTVRRMIDLVPADMAAPPGDRTSRARGESGESRGPRRRRSGRRRRS